VPQEQGRPERRRRGRGRRWPAHAARRADGLRRPGRHALPAALPADREGGRGAGGGGRRDPLRGDHQARPRRVRPGAAPGDPRGEPVPRDAGRPGGDPDVPGPRGRGGQQARPDRLLRAPRLRGGHDGPPGHRPLQRLPRPPGAGRRVRSRAGHRVAGGSALVERAGRDDRTLLRGRHPGGGGGAEPRRARDDRPQRRPGLDVRPPVQPRCAMAPAVGRAHVRLRAARAVPGPPRRSSSAPGRRRGARRGQLRERSQPADRLRAPELRRHLRHRPGDRAVPGLARRARLAPGRG
jgi:hypothetical protein